MMIGAVVFLWSYYSYNRTELLYIKAYLRFALMEIDNLFSY